MSLIKNTQTSKRLRMACQSSNLKTSPSSRSSSSRPSKKHIWAFRQFPSVRRSPPTKILCGPPGSFGTYLKIKRIEDTRHSYQWRGITVKLLPLISATTSFYDNSVLRTEKKDIYCWWRCWSTSISSAVWVSFFIRSPSGYCREVVLCQKLLEVWHEYF